MSTGAVTYLPPRAPLPEKLTGSRSPGWWGMVFICCTEAMLFASFIASLFPWHSYGPAENGK